VESAQAQSAATLINCHYVEEMLHIMVPKLASKQEDIQVKIAILRVIGQLAQRASRMQLLELLEVLLPILVQLLEEEALYLKKYVRFKKKRRSVNREATSDGKKHNKRKRHRRMSSANDLLMSITTHQGMIAGEDLMSSAGAGYSSEAITELKMLKQWVTLETLGLIIECTGFVVEPYIQQKNLMSLLLECVSMNSFHSTFTTKTNNVTNFNYQRQLTHVEAALANSESSSFYVPNSEEIVDVLSQLGWNIQREAIRVVGIIGALDPFLHNNNLITLTVMKSSRQMFHQKKRLELQKKKKKKVKRLKKKTTTCTKHC